MALWEFVVKHWLTVIFGIVTATLTAGYRRLEKRFQKDKEENKAMREGVKALLADRIIEMYNHYTDKGFCPIYAKRNAEYLFNAYGSLNGNGTTKELYNRLMSMPTEKKEEGYL